MIRKLAWIVLAALAVCAIYGCIREQLFHQALWSPQGLLRLLGFAAVFWTLTGVVIWLRPRWLGSIVSALVLLYSVWWCARFFNALAPFAVLYFLGSCYLLGRIVTRWVVMRKTDGITTLLLGLSIWIFAISIFVRFPVNSRAVYWIAFAVPYVIRGGDLIPALRELFRISSPARRIEAAAFAVLLFTLLLQWMIALKPEVGSDALAMHLAIPMTVGHQARWSFDFERYTWALMPTGGDWAFTAAYLLGGEAASRLLNFAMLVLLAAMVCRASRRWLAPAGAFLAAALFASTPLVQLVTGSLFVENIWAALITGAALALGRGELMWAGVLFGAAMSVKVGTAAFVIPAALAGALFCVWNHEARKLWRSVAVAAALFIVFAAPPYLTAWWKTQNPLYPFENRTFRSPYFEPANILQDVRFQKKLSWKTPYDATFRSSGYFEGRGGGLGFQYFLFLVPLLLLLGRRAPRAVLAVGIGGAIITLATQPNLRYVYPALPLLSIGFAWLIAEISLPLICVLALTAVNLWFLPASDWDPDFALFRADQVEEYLKRSAPQRRLIDYVNRTYPGETIGFLGGSGIAGLDARAYTDRWHTFRFWQRLIRARRAEDVAALYREFGIRHLIALLPPDTDSVAERNFVEQWTAETGVSFGRCALLALRDAPEPLPAPPPAPPGSYDDHDPRVQFSGAWIADRQFAQAFEGTLTYANQAGDTARFEFTGGAITYLYTKTFNRGIAEVRIDGRLRASLDEYSRSTEWRTAAGFRDLSPGPHIIEIRATARKNPRSSDTWVDLDGFVVDPPAGVK